MALTSRGPVSLLAAVCLLAGCSAFGEPREPTANRAQAPASTTTSPRTSGPPTPERPAPTPSPSPPEPREERSEAAPETPLPGPRAAAWISIPAIGVDDLRVVAYRGTADDRPGTRIQNRGVAASPRGPEGGVVPGKVGNYIVTAHRLSAGGPFHDVPALERGDHVLVRSGGHVYDYKITRSLWISFRSERSRASQSAPVPGHLERRATRASITLSTCATLEDHAAGNYWADENDNPEHRIDKVGVLVDVRPA